MRVAVYESVPAVVRHDCFVGSARWCPTLCGQQSRFAVQVSPPATAVLKDAPCNHRDGYMDRWTWMMVRMYAPALAAFALGLLLTLPLGMLRESPVLAGVYAMVRWLPALAIAVSVTLALGATLRLWHWDQGRSALVCECGGLLGRERPGRFGAYRKCLACNRNVNERYYT